MITSDEIDPHESTKTPNIRAEIPAGGSQSFVLALTANTPIATSDITFNIRCFNTASSSSIVGVNGLLLTASPTPTADIIALGVTSSHDGVVNIPGANGMGTLAVATSNVGVTARITVSADTGGRSLPVIIFLCQTNPATGACITSIDSSVTTQMDEGATAAFAVFVQGVGTVPFSPGVNRLFVRFKTTNGTTVGSTSAALATR